MVYEGFVHFQLRVSLFKIKFHQSIVCYLYRKSRHKCMSFVYEANVSSAYISIQLFFFMLIDPAFPYIQLTFFFFFLRFRIYDLLEEVNLSSDWIDEIYFISLELWRTPRSPMYIHFPFIRLSRNSIFLWFLLQINIFSWLRSLHFKYLWSIIRKNFFQVCWSLK